jgi:hypothetical protein
MKPKYWMLASLLALASTRASVPQGAAPAPAQVEDRERHEKGDKGSKHWLLTKTQPGGSR